MAISALWSNKMRSLLTMLGIIIGVGAVIAMVSIGMGVQKQVEDSIASLGSNMLIVNASATRNAAGVRQAAGSNVRLKLEDAQAIKEKITDAEYVSPSVQRNYQIVNGNQNWNTQVVGVTPDYMYIRSLSIANGTFITQKDVDSRSRVAVIGTTVAENLFGEGVNPVGKNIRINNDPFKVVGLLESKGQSSVGQDQDDIVIIPITTATMRVMAINYIQSISVQVVSADKMDQVQAEIENLMRQRHRITGDKEDDFTVRDIIETAHRQAIEILNAHRKDVELIATTLLEKETITAEEIASLVNTGALPKKEKADIASGSASTAEGVPPSTEPAAKPDEPPLPPEPKPQEEMGEGASQPSSKEKKE